MRVNCNSTIRSIKEALARYDTSPAVPVDKMVFGFVDAVEKRIVVLDSSDDCRMLCNWPNLAKEGSIIRVIYRLLGGGCGGGAWYGGGREDDKMDTDDPANDGKMDTDDDANVAAAFEVDVSRNSNGKREEAPGTENSTDSCASCVTLIMTEPDDVNFTALPARFSRT